MTVPAGSIDIWGGAQLQVLSVGRGHLTLTITEDNEEEITRARRIIEDMLTRGFAIFVEDPDGTQHRVRKFHPDRMTYVIDDSKLVKDAEKAAKKATREVPVATSRATAVGRSAGG